MIKITKITRKNITLESIEKIFKLRFEIYRDKFIGSKIPLMDQHMIFIYAQICNTDINWFGIYKDIDSGAFPDLLALSCLYNHDRKNSSIEFGRLMVDPLFKSNGLATNLLAYSLEYAKSKLYCKNVFLSVKKENKCAIKLYERHGFSLISSSNPRVYKINL